MLPDLAGKASGYPPGVLVEQRLIIVRAESGRKIYINSEPVSRAALGRRLHEIFRTRVERAAYVMGEPEVSFGEVADVIGIVREVVPNIGLLTGSTEPTISESLLGWPNGSYPGKERWN